MCCSLDSWVTAQWISRDDVQERILACRSKLSKDIVRPKLASTRAYASSRRSPAS